MFLLISRLNSSDIICSDCKFTKKSWESEWIIMKKNKNYFYKPLAHIELFRKFALGNMIKVILL